MNCLNSLSTNPNSMYSQWSAIRAVELSESSRVSVLHKLPQLNGPLLVNSCVRPLASMLTSNTTTNTSTNTTNTLTNANTNVTHYESSDYLQNDRDVLWIMEVICYGLSLPLSSAEQHEAVRDCVHIYCEWIQALTPQKAKYKTIPFPIRDDPNLYCRKILEHIYNIFIPRNFTGNESNLLDMVSRQAVLCHRLLRTIECIAHDEYNLMDRQTWDSLLLFLLAINDTLLSPPVEVNDIGTQLCERIVSVLFEIWLVACCRSFPSPSYWKTLQQLCISWRHRPALIDQWNRINYSLTLRLVQQMSPSVYDFNANTPTLQKNFLNAIIDEMNEETLKQSWYRFLHTIGNPVDLCSPDIISKTDKFYHSACASENVVDPRQHPCLNNLPHIFYKAMKGISTLVDTFLGIPVVVDDIDVDKYKSTASVSMSLVSGSVQPPATPPEKRKPGFPLNINKAPNKTPGLTKSMLKMEPIANSLPTITFPSAPEYILPPTRPKSTSILDILGDWLFQSSLFGTDLKDQMETNEITRSNSSASFTQTNDLQRKASAASDRILIETLPLLNSESFEAGQAEAIGALCRLFCFKRADEEISLMLNKQSHPAFQKVKHYLTRFHLALQYGLSINKEPLRRQILSSILINSAKIFEVDLPGGSLLIPHFLKAMEIYLFPKDKLSIKSEIEIRRACIKLLLSLLSYPLHFNELPIKDTLSEMPSTTFQSLRPRLINLLIQALSGEPDSINIQMILGGFLLAVEDASMHDNFCQIDSENTSESIRSNSFSEPLRADSPGLQLSQHFTFGQMSCDSSLASTDIPFSDDGKGIPDTAKGLFGRFLFHVGQVLNKCRDKNQYDSHVSLAALEVLSAIGRIHLSNGSKNQLNSSCFIECKESIKQIFWFIESQCDKPAPFHSKDMHSTIVAAYQCLAVWFHEHPHLLKDRDCISALLEVIELGISGSKSKKNGFVFKADKQLKPASMRVREAAESLLTLLMNHFGFCPPSPSPPETIVGSCLLDESSLLKYMYLGNNLSQESACNRFKYFVNDNLIMLGILDHPNDRETVCIIRSPFGKYCWSFKFQHLPRKHNFKLSSDSVSRPLPRSETTSHASNAQIRHFPESLDKIRLTKFDAILPTLSTMIAESPEFKSDQEIMFNIIDRVENHMKYEKQRLHKTPSAGRSTECKEPSVSTDFEAARLILSHFSFLTFETLQDAPMGQMIPSLIALNNKSPDFSSNLKILDSISNRTSDTIFVYYVRKGCKNAEEILSHNKQQTKSNAQFREFVQSLGCVVDVKSHSGWTGHMATAWKVIDEDNLSKQVQTEDNHLIFDGRKHVLYWADVSHELVFILPSGPIPEEGDNSSLDGDYKLRASSDAQSDARSVSSMSDDGSASNHSKNVSENESTRSSLRRKFRNLLLHNIGCDVKVLILWMESMDDHFSLPINTLLLTTGTGVESNLNLWKDYILILIHPLKNGLFRITIQGSAGRTPMALPLIDGMVVSKHVLGTVVRLSSLNICRRRRLDTESFQPPHVKRRLKIQDIVNKYRLVLPESEFYNSLFTSK